MCHLCPSDYSILHDASVMKRVQDLGASIEELHRKLDRLLDMQVAKAYADQPDDDNYDDHWWDNFHSANPVNEKCDFCDGNNNIGGGSLGDRLRKCREGVVY